MVLLEQFLNTTLLSGASSSPVGGAVSAAPRLAQADTAGFMQGGFFFPPNDQKEPDSEELWKSADICKTLQTGHFSERLLRRLMR